MEKIIFDVALSIGSVLFILLSACVNIGLVWIGLQIYKNNDRFLGKFVGVMFVLMAVALITVLAVNIKQIETLFSFEI